MKSYFNSERNLALLLKPSGAIRLFMMVLFLAFSGIVNAQTFVGPGTDWNTASNWSPAAVPSKDISSTITINSSVTVSSIVVKNHGNLIVNSPAVLTVGTIGNSASTQVVDFQNGSKVTINTGASMIVYGLLNNSNNSNDIKFDGAVNVMGNVTVGNGSTVTGSGSLSSTGTVTGDGTVFGTGDDCNSGDGCNYGCSVNTISTTQTICSGSTAVLTGNASTGYSYQWQSSTTSSSTGFSNISGANGNNYTSSALMTTTYFRRIVSVSGCSSSNSNVIKVTITSLPTAPSNIRGWNATCNGYVVAWDGSATKFYLDVATTSTFDSGTIVSSYDNKDVGNVNSLTLTGLTSGTTYYFRVRAFSSSCLSNNSLLGNFTTLSVAVPTNVRSENVNWCTSTVKWDGSATKYYLDVATNNTFSAGAILPTYNNLDVGNVNSLILSGLSPNTTYYFRVRRLETCGLSDNSSVSNFTTMTIASPTANSGFANCNDWTAQWNRIYNISGNAADGYYLDVAIDNAFTNYVSGYQNLYVGDVIAYNLTGLARGGTYFFRVRAKTSCGSGGNSNVVTFTEKGNGSSNAGTISGVASICVGQNTTFTNNGSNPSTGTWSIFNQTGAATITNGGVVTGTAVGTVSVVYTVGSGCLTSSTQSLTITSGGTVSSASSSPTPCINTVMTTITHTTTGFTGISNSGVSGANGLPLGVSASFASNAVTISGTPIQSGSFSYSIPLTGSCGAVNAIGIITVNSLSVAPTGITGTTTICNGNSTTLTISGGTAGTGATAQWFTASCGGTSAGTGNSITVSPTSNTTYYVRYSGTCNTTTCASTTVTVNPLPVAPGPIAGTFTVCQGQANIGYSVPVIANATGYSWSYSGTGATITNGTTNTPTVTFASNAVSGNLTVYGVDSCGNGVVSANYTITVNPLLSAPTVGTITHATCVSAGSVVLNDLPASGTLIQTGTAANSYAITGTTMIISGLVAGTYNFSSSNGSCPSASTGNVVINSSDTKIWNGTSWSPSSPTSSDVAVINADYYTSSNGDLNVCSLIINPGFKLTIDPGQFVTIQNNLTIETGAVLDVLDQGSLVMVNNLGIVTNNGTGTAKIHRFTTAFKKNDYVYWSTPVSTAAISSASTGTFPGWRTGYAYEYNNAWVYATTMSPAKGYIVMVPDPTNAPGGNVSEAVFKGKVNNGVYNINIVANKSYLIGNPYPSAIDADQFILQNSDVIGGALYFWTHNTAIQLASNITNGTAGSGAYAYTSDDYAAYNIVGGVGVAKATAKSGGDVPLGKIASGQGFFTTTKATISGTSFVFNNSMRISSGATSNSQFFKTKVSKNNNKTAAIEKHRVWLNLSNAQGAFKQTLLGYIGGATNGDDPLFDGKTLDGNKFVDFYSVNQSKNLVIQGRALPFDDKDEVPLGYKTAIDGTFTINIDKADGLLTNQAIFLEDKLTNTVFNLKNGDYTFTTAKGTFNNRFVLKYSNKTLGTEDFNASVNEVIVSVKNKQIKINSFAETIDKVLIYDVSGKQIYKNERVENNELSVTNFTLADQVLIVKTTLQNGTVTTNKIIY